MEGVEGEGSLTQVDQTLGQPHHEEVALVLGVILSQLSQHGGQPGVVGSGPDQSQTEDGGVSNLWVCVVRELGQSVQDGTNAYASGGPVPC